VWESCGVSTSALRFDVAQTVTLSPEQLSELARLIAAELREAPEPGGLVDAATLAEKLGTSRDYVYEHAGQLGAVKLGEGKRPRLRFDVSTARAAYERSMERPPKVAPRRRTQGAVVSVPNRNAPATRKRPGAGQRS
jgi:hypothetical protein